MKLYCLEGGDIVSVDATFDGEYYRYRGDFGERPVHKDAVDSHWWFTTAEELVSYWVSKMREAREVFIAARDSAAARVQQIEERIAKLEALL